jgi:hypothetical protein
MRLTSLVESLSRSNSYPFTPPTARPETTHFWDTA